MPRILFIGPTLSADTTTIGGTTISFDILIKHAQAHHCEHSVISVNRRRQLWLNALLVLRDALVLIPRHQVIMLNANPRGALMLAPIIAFYTRLWRRKYVFRMFGGDLIEIYQAQPSLLKLVMRKSILTADRTYLQTKRMIRYFDHVNSNIDWLPTSRVLGNRTVPKPFSGRFVYIGQIKQNKGIDLILDVIAALPNTSITLYGPILETRYEKLETKVCYGGVLPPESVGERLKQYDVLLLPTFHPGEGYPGIIIEAFAAGLPVITTNWLSIPEIVEDKFNGLLISPHSASELSAAITSINCSNFPTLAANAASSAAQFDSLQINRRILDDLKQLGSKSR